MFVAGVVVAIRVGFAAVADVLSQGSPKTAPRPFFTIPAWVSSSCRRQIQRDCHASLQLVRARRNNVPQQAQRQAVVGRSPNFGA